MYLEQQALDYFRQYDFRIRHLKNNASRHLGEISSRILGRNMEFEQYSEYSPGDDPRAIDWKVFARTNRLYIKNYGSDISTDAMIILDKSFSMAYPSGNQSKFETAKKIASLLCYIFSGKNNRVFFSTICDRFDEYGQVNNERLEELLLAIRPEGKTKPEKIAFEAKPGLAFIISDGWWDTEENEASTDHLIRNRVHWINLLTQDELELNLSGNLELHDLENGTKIHVIPSEIREKYAESMKSKIHHIQKIYFEKQLLYSVFNTGIPYYVLLKDFLDSIQRNGI